MALTDRREGSGSMSSTTPEFKVTCPGLYGTPES
jgi:hypothetical protein